jgi:antitoxin (DNA-binding transcriptional repressor) of toxin-antitoxin stability system
MEVSITQFRRDLFKLVHHADEGHEVWFTHKGRRYKIAPEEPGGDRLSRITPLQVINPDGPGLEDESWKEEMMREWENQWDDL